MRAKRLIMLMRKTSQVLRRDSLNTAVIQMSDLKTRLLKWLFNNNTPVRKLQATLACCDFKSTQVCCNNNTVIVWDGHNSRQAVERCEPITSSHRVCTLGTLEIILRCTEDERSLTGKFDRKLVANWEQVRRWFYFILYEARKWPNFKSLKDAELVWRIKK